MVQFGLVSTPATFQVQVKKFLSNYLGSPENPVPFGGRDAEIRQLNGWLADGAAAPNILITAPAGRGKTALLVRWVAQLPPEIFIVFVPISIRYNTNRAGIFYQAFAARLAGLLEENLPSTPSDPAAFYKEKTIEYLDRLTDKGRQCLIVLDGLDEATGWRVDTSVLPALPKAGLKIVVSARQLAGDYGSKNWLQRLGWSARGRAMSYEVPPLTREGIADVLYKMGFPLAHLAKDVDIVGELKRLTEGGDPLLLELYVNRLSEGDVAARLKPEQLAQLKPGFGPYFKDWFELQRTIWEESNIKYDEDQLNGLLALLSSAIGPIELNALGQLMDRLLGNRRLITVHTLAPIQRFVIGDGVENGFALGHPKLAEYLQTEYFGLSGIVKQASNCFVEWGQQVVRDLNDGKLKPAEAPKYALHYYVQHLEAGQPGVPVTYYRDLIENGWRLAWFNLEKGFGGFARDLEVVWTRLREISRNDPKALRESRIGLGGLMRCALCLSSIRSIGANVPPNFLAELVGQGLLAPRQALHFCRLKPEREQATALKALASQLAPEIALEAIADVQGMQNPQEKSTTLAVLANRLSDPMQSELLRTALKVAEQCPENYQKSAAKRFIESLVMPTDDVAAARLPTPAVVDTGLGAGKPQLTQRPEQLRDELHRGLSALRWERLAIIEPLAPSLTPELFEEALSVMATWDGYDRSSFFAAVADSLPDDLLVRTVQVLPDWKNDYCNADILAAIGSYLPVEAIPQALDQAFEMGYYVSKALSTLASRLDSAQLDQVLGRVLELRSYHRAEPVAVLVPFLNHDQFRSMLAAVMRFDEYERQSTLSSLAPVIPKPFLGEVVAAVSDRIADLDKLLPHLSTAERATAVKNAYGNAFQIRDGVLFVAAFAALARHAPQSEADALLQKALNAAQDITEDLQRAIAMGLISASPRLSPELARSYFLEALKCAERCAINDRTPLLCLATLLPSASKEEIDRINNEVLALEKPDLATSAIVALSPRLSDAGFSRILQTIEDHSAGDATMSGLLISKLLLALAPHTPRDRARKYLQDYLDETSKKEQPDVFDSVLGLLSPALTPDLKGRFEKIARQEPSEIDLRAIIASALLNYAPDEMETWLLEETLQPLASLQRPFVLAALSICEGEWGEAIQLRPALSEGRPPARLSFRVGGGDETIHEFVAAVSDVKQWWP